MSVTSTYFLPYMNHGFPVHGETASAAQPKTAGKFFPNFLYFSNPSPQSQVRIRIFVISVKIACTKSRMFPHRVPYKVPFRHFFVSRSAFFFNPAPADLRIIRKNPAAAPFISVLQAFHVVDRPDIHPDSMVSAVFTVFSVSPLIPGW